MRAVGFQKPDEKRKILSGEKIADFRTVYIPDYQLGQSVMLQFKDANGNKEDLFMTTIDEITPVRIKDLTNKHANLCGFPGLLEMMNDINGKMKKGDIDENRWGFIIRWTYDLDAIVLKRC